MEDRKEAGLPGVGVWHRMQRYYIIGGRSTDIPMREPLRRKAMAAS